MFDLKTHAVKALWPTHVNARWSIARVSPT